MHGIIPYEMTRFGASILEGMMTSALVYIVYTAADPRRGSMAAIGPLAIGFIAGANVLASTNLNLLVAYGKDGGVLLPLSLLQHSPDGYNGSNSRQIFALCTGRDWTM